MNKEVDIERVIDIAQLLKKTTYSYLEKTIEDIKTGVIKNPEFIEDLKSLYMDFIDDPIYYDYYKELCLVLNKKCAKEANNRNDGESHDLCNG